MFFIILRDKIDLIADILFIALTALMVGGGWGMIFWLYIELAGR
jgi:hypothetical protein